MTAIDEVFTRVLDNAATRFSDQLDNFLEANGDTADLQLDFASQTDRLAGQLPGPWSRSSSAIDSSQPAPATGQPSLRRRWTNGSIVLAIDPVVGYDGAQHQWSWFGERIQVCAVRQTLAGELDPRMDTVQMDVVGRILPFADPSAGWEGRFTSLVLSEVPTQNEPVNTLVEQLAAALVQLLEHSQRVTPLVTQHQRLKETILQGISERDPARIFRDLREQSR